MSVWPTPVQEWILQACFAPEREAGTALDSLASQANAELDPATARLAVLLYRRWPAFSHAITATGREMYLVQWRENRERFASMLEVAGRLRSRGIECLALKGAALVARHYRELGLRGMRDFDLLVAEDDFEAAARELANAGYSAEDGYAPRDFERRKRTGHAWQFAREGVGCDLHWRPVVRCYAPEVTRLFWEGAETTAFGDGELRAPSATDQLFHVCAHGLQWDWQPSVRWIADALTVLREPVDWERVARLARAARMHVRLATALDYLRDRFGAPVPTELAADLRREAPAWERREYACLLKPCPLGFRDSLWWHADHFRRIREFDSTWSSRAFCLGFVEYVARFLDADSALDLWRRVKPALQARERCLSRKPIPCPATIRFPSGRDQ
ncbi:MAG: nucleotidyltransferase family protein [Acidobacteriales bacterium]|nr:nucleotidyltransferase family protein [Terriglobales bacterium]